ncbi:hypothetical protein L596_024623 [Steinernema carpocapsae]|uniref:Adenosine 3'-phospho 5'-phosphosulfate transporter 2 n=1 Tax=Steinernema carpocapsae TaxID=34508 RepID=A0A4U5M599_STECR|nr:hypothetical protein L596_024623 [Steinernema carpocapsae]
MPTWHARFPLVQSRSICVLVDPGAPEEPREDEEAAETAMLPFQKKDVDDANATTPPIHLLGVNITKWKPWQQFVVLSSAVFVLYVGYGYCQELIFKLDGMKPFGAYLTLIQFWIYSILAYVERQFSHESGRRIPMKTYVQLAFYTVGTMVLSNASVGYLNYPTQVIFKCCKLVPVMIGGMLIQGKRYGLLDFAAVLLMTLGLTIFSYGDMKAAPNYDWRGYIMISGALVADAIIGNVQEKAMKGHKAGNNEMVLYSYSLGSLYVLAGTIISGEFWNAFWFFLEHPLQTYGYACIFSLLGYLGVNVVLTLVRTTGALTAVTVTTLRKAVTIALSFILFSKPFVVSYAIGGTIVLFGIYINLYSKNRVAFNALYRRFLHGKIAYKTQAMSV